MQKCKKFLAIALAICLVSSFYIMPTFAANVAILDWHLVDSGNHLD